MITKYLFNYTLIFNCIISSLLFSNSINGTVQEEDKPLVSIQAISTILWLSLNESPVVSISRNISDIIWLYQLLFF